MIDHKRIIEVLEHAKHEHYDGGTEGLTACDARKYEKVDGDWQYVIYPELCECGATEINAEIDDLIDELKLLYGDPSVPEPQGVIDASKLVTPIEPEPSSPSPTCSTCKHWGRAWPNKAVNKRNCDQLSGPTPDDNDDGIIDDDGTSRSFYTGPQFGCIFHEELEQ